MTNNLPNPSLTHLPIGVQAQYIKDFSFESPNVPQIFSEFTQAPELGLDVNLRTRLVGDNAHEVVLKLRVTARIKDHVAFIAELDYAGIFVFPASDEEQTRQYLLIEAPRFLFPFARAIIAQAVQEGGFPNLLLQPIDFVALYNANKDRIGAMQTQGVA